METQTRSGRARVMLPGMPGTRRAPQEPWELPFKLLWVGNFTQRPDPRALDDRKPITVHRDSFEKVMGEHKLALSFAGGEPLRFRRIADMEPGAIALQAPALAGRVEEILRDRRMENLGAAWRDLEGALLRIEPRADVRIDILNCSIDDLHVDFEDTPEIPRTGLYKTLYTGEYGGPGGRPYAAVLFQDLFCPGDVFLLRKIFQIAAAAQTPAIIRPTTGLAAAAGLHTVRATTEEGRYAGFGVPALVAPILTESFARTGTGAGIGGIDPLLWVGARVAAALMIRHRYALADVKTAYTVEAFQNAWLATLAADPDDGTRPFRAARLVMAGDAPDHFSGRLFLDAHGDAAAPTGPVELRVKLDKE